MHVLAPDILEEASGLTPGLTMAGCAVGFLLWLLGWWGHRFWIVLAITAVAGVWGLRSAPALGAQPLVAGLLVAAAAGLLALAVVRVVAFAAGGTATALAVHAFIPQWDEPLLCFLAGGLVALLLVRLWTMALTSGMGTVLLAYSGLALAGRLGKVNVVELADKYPLPLDAACAGVALIGIVVQFLISRRRPLDEDEEERRSRYFRSRWSDRSRWFNREEGVYRRAS